MALKSRLGGFPTSLVARGATIKTYDRRPWVRVPDVRQEAHAIEPMAAHGLPPWVHGTTPEAKIWSLGVYAGLRRRHPKPNSKD